MKLEIGVKMPLVEVPMMGAQGPEVVKLAEKLAGRKVVIFGLPGAFTGTCSTAHLPSFIETIDDFRAKGVDEVICVSVNDVFVMQAWGAQTGATEAGITMLPDPAAVLTKAIEMDFSVAEIGLHDRSQRYAALVEDGIVTQLQIDEPGQCSLSTGNSLLPLV